MGIVSEVWFWLIIVGVIIVITGIIIIVLLSGDRTLGIIVLVFGIILTIAGIGFAIYKASTKPIDVGEAGRDIVNPALRQRIIEQAESFNQRYDTAAQKFINTEYKPLVEDFGKAAGNLAFLLQPK